MTQKKSKIENRKLVSLFFRNLFFTILQPGLVAGLFPYWILGRKAEEILVNPFVVTSYIGIVVFTIGLVVMLSCIVRFAIEGRGTLSPADPTKRLVIHGLYKYSRNPMYVGVMLILTGESVFFNSTQLWMYSLFVFICFNLFVLIIEEPRLKRDFNPEYEKYCRRVRRWF